MRPVTLTTRILVRELASGDVLAVPVSDPQHTSFGTAEEALAEQSIFLAEHLAQARPEVALRFALPQQTRLHVTRVLVPREDLPHAVAITQPIEIPCVVIPSSARGKSDAWVVIVPLDYTFFVAAGEDLDRAVSSEVLRLVAAEEAGALHYLSLLPGVHDSLEPLDVKIERGEDGPAGRAASHRKALAVREKKKHAAAVLASIATPLHMDEGAPRPMLGRDADKRLLASILGGQERQSVVIVGEPRVGKTALLRAWLADEAAARNTRLVYATSGAQLIAGMSGLGQWQERVRRVMEAAHTLDAILYFDDLADLFGERAHGIDIAGAMKPYLEEGKVRLVGELAKDRAEQIESRHVGFFSCTSRIRLEAMTPVQTLVALRAHAVHDGKHEPHKVQVTDAALVALVDLAERYLPYEAFPGKAARLYDDLRASHELARKGAGTRGAELDAGDVFEWFSVRTGVPTFLLRDDSPLRQETILAHFDKRLVGQEEAKARVQGVISVVKAGLQPTGKPLATFLFVGPTGVGKTELARATAELLFGNADRLVRFDRSEYTDPWAAERLIRGTERGDGLLTRKVREQPFSVVLLDEIEKAHPAVFDLLLQVCGEGRLTDGRGKTAYFHNTILIMTSNLGAAHRRASVGFDGERAGASDQAYYMKKVEETFRPEMVNRLDRVVAFRSLTADEIRHVTRLAVERVRARRGLTTTAIELVVSDLALEQLATGGFSDAYGARALRRHVEDHLTTPVARLLAASSRGATRGSIDVRTADEPDTTPADELVMRIDDSGLMFTARSRPRVAVAAQTSVWSLSEMRRELQRHMRLERVVELKSQLDFVIAQLSYGDADGKGKKKKKGTELARTANAEMGRLSAEHHKLNEVWSALESAFADLQSAEELGFAAFFAGEPSDGLLAEATTLKARFRTALLAALVCRDPKRFGITLMLQELDNGRALDVWLAPLLEASEARGWELTLHVDANTKEDRADHPRWPEARRWGPPRTASVFKEMLAAKDRPFKNVLLCARGPNVGVLLGLEGGLLRFNGVDPDVDPCHLLVTRIAFRATMREKDWLAPTLVPPVPGAADHARRQQPAREVFANEGIVSVFAKRSTLKIPLRDYWARHDEIALEHLLLFETRDDLDRDGYLTAVFQDEWDDVTELVRQGLLIEAIKRYRERTGVGLKEAKDYVDALRGS